MDGPNPWPSLRPRHSIVVNTDSLSTAFIRYNLQMFCSTFVACNSNKIALHLLYCCSTHSATEGRPGWVGLDNCRLNIKTVSRRLRSSGAITCHTVVLNSSGRQVVWCRRTAALEQAACFTAVVWQSLPIRKTVENVFVCQGLGCGA